MTEPTRTHGLARRAGVPGGGKAPGVQVAAFVLLLLAVTLSLHVLEFRAAAWSIDEYIFATGGQKIVSGGMLYRDFGDNKPPLIYYTNALLYWLSGEDFLNFFFISKFATILVIFLTGLAFYAAGKNLGGKNLGMVSALFYVAYSICGPSGEMLGGRTEIYSTLLAVASIYFFSRDGFSLRIMNMLLSGFLLSIATIYNAKFGVAGVAYLLFIAYKCRTVRGAVPPVASLGAAYVPLLAAVPVCFYLLGVNEYYRFWQSTVFKHYLEVLPFYYLVPAGLLVLVFLAGIAPLSVFSFYRIVSTLRMNSKSGNRSAKKGDGGAPGIMRRAAGFFRRLGTRDSRHDVSVFLILLLLVQFLSFFVGGIPGVRYFYMMLIPICFLAAQGLFDVYGAIRDALSAGALSRVLNAILVLFLVGPPVFFFMMHYNSRKELLIESMQQHRDAVEYIRLTTDPGQRIFVWSNMQPIYLYSGRTVATSMVYPTEFLARYYYFTGEFRRDTTAWDIFFRQLESDPPVLILDNTGNFITRDTVLYAKKNRYVDVKLEEFRRYVGNKYEYKATLSGFRIYRRRP